MPDYETVFADFLFQSAERKRRRCVLACIGRSQRIFACRSAHCGWSAMQ